MHRSLAGVVLLMGCLLAACANAPPAREQAPPEPIPAALLQRDVDVLEQALALHPGLYRYNTPDQVQASLARLRRELGRDASLPEAYLAFTRFTASLRCGHTFLNPANQSAAVSGRLFHSPTRVPFHFRWLDGRMVVVRNFSGDPALAPGAQVLAVDGLPTPELHARMLPLVRGDGHNDAKRSSLLEVLGGQQYETFDVLLPLLHPVGARLRLKVLVPGAAGPREVVVDAHTQAQRLAQRPTTARAKFAPAWHLRDAGDGVVVLEMPSWAVYDHDWDWRGWLQDAFAQPLLRDSRALVLDLRANEGGSDVGSELLPHFIDAAVPLPGYLRKTRYRATPAALRPHLATWDASFHDWGAQAQPLGDGFYRLERGEMAAEGVRIEPAAPRYQGRLYVLVSAVNSSATFEFARAVRRAGAGTLVGQPTGGNLRGINGGAFFFLNLPHSRLEIDLPLIGQFPLEPQPDAGLQPDLLVPVSVEAIASGRDAELDAVRGHLRAD